MEETTNTESEQKFRDIVEEFNKKNSRHVEIAGDYQGSNKPVEFYEKSVIDGKTYENRWYQIPQNFAQGHEGNPLLKHKSVPDKLAEMASETEKAEKFPDNFQSSQLTPEENDEFDKIMQDKVAHPEKYRNLNHKTVPLDFEAVAKMAENSQSEEKAKDSPAD